MPHNRRESRGLVAWYDTESLRWHSSTSATRRPRAVLWRATMDPDTAPGLEIIDGPGPYTSSTSATFAWTHDDQDSEFECKTDDGAFEPCASPLFIEGLTEGQHRFAVRVVDAEDETTAQEQLEWIIDLTAPIRAGDRSDGHRSRTGSSSGGRRPPTRHSSLVTSCIWTRELKAEQSRLRRFTFHGLTCGAHSIGVEAVDAAGNVSARTLLETTARCAVERPRCVVPSLVGKRLARATALLNEANCRHRDGDSTVLDPAAGPCASPVGPGWPGAPAGIPDQPRGE